MNEDIWDEILNLNNGYKIVGETEDINQAEDIYDKGKLCYMTAGRNRIPIQCLTDEHLLIIITTYHFNSVIGIIANREYNYRVMKHPRRSALIDL